MLELQNLFSKKLLLVTGKGGIGKTIVTAALGQLAAASGIKTLLVESSHQDQLAPLFGLAPVGHRETAVGAGLSCINLDPSENFREYVVKYLGQKLLFDKVFSNRLVQSFIHTIPGFAEVMMLGRLYYAAELAPERADLVIFDGYASGHFLSLMTTPDAVIGSGIGGPLAHETQRVRDFLADSERVGTLYVGVPEDLVVSECLDFLPQLAAQSPAKLLGLVINRALQLKAEQGPALPDSLAWRYMHQKIQRAQQALQSLETGLLELSELGTHLPLVYLPDLGFIEEPLSANFANELLSAFVAANAD